MPTVPARIIATEEGFNVPEIVEAYREFLSVRGHEEPTLVAMRRSGPPDWPRLLDMDQRLLDMDRARIDTQLLLLSSPGVQIFDPARATELARHANDVAAAWVRAHPARFRALAAIAPQAPDDAASELERAVSQLGMHGAVINSNTRGAYLDEPRFDPIFEAAERLGVPIYLHPREPAAGVIDLYSQWGLETAVWGYAAETSLHALRLIISGLFDRHPGLTLVLGHNGENIPFALDRIDNRYLASRGMERFPLKRRPSEYFRDNIAVTTSGSNWWPAVRHCIDVLGPQNVMFAADYPFEDEDDAVARALDFPLGATSQAMFFHGNAERIFGITTD